MSLTTLFTEAKADPERQLGALLEQYRSYLHVLAAASLDPLLSQRVDVSDVVQDTLFDAAKDFGVFRGQNEHAFRKWLRAILSRNVLRLVEQHIQTQKRDARKEFSWENVRAGIEHSGVALESLVADKTPTPSSECVRRENASIIAEELNRLSPDYRQVIILRNFQDMPFSEIGGAMNRSEKAATMLWMRAVSALGKRLSQRGIE